MKTNTVLCVLLLLSACGVSETQQKSVSEQSAPQQSSETVASSELLKKIAVNTEVEAVGEATASVATESAKQRNKFGYGKDGVNSC